MRQMRLPALAAIAAAFALCFGPVAMASSQTPSTRLAQQQSPFTETQLKVYRPSSPEIAFRTRKVKALLAYLAWPPGTPHSRDKLAALLWGGSGDAQARNSLRNHLSMLRKSLSDAEAEIVIGNGDRLYLDPRSVDVDAVTFDHLVSQGTTEALEQAASLCTGDFLEDFDLREEGFAEWVAAERARFHEKAVMVLTRLLETHLASGDVEQGIQVAFRLIRSDPLQEWAHSALIRLYLQQERYGAALRQYETYRVLLTQELGVAPSAEVEALYQGIRNHRRLAEQSANRRISPNDEAGTGEQADLAGVNGRAVAILPFANLSQDPEQELFVDGLTEDIIFALSATRSFPVLARNAIMSFKGRAVDAQTAGKALGAAYVLEGSVRRSSDQLRIIVELVDVETRLQLWSERYDRSMGDLLAIQNDITTTVVATLEPEIDVQEMRRVMVAQPLTKRL